MDTQDFIRQLNEAQELMKNEKYKEAIILLEKLKMIEKRGDFDYSLTHKLYQLDSNSHSLYNQQIILKHISIISEKQKSISFHDLNKILKEKEVINIEEAILIREIELLILRGLLSCKIEGNKIKF